ncbi:MAG TPA: glycine oxidase ThiO [Planctomycetota bacterium]|nr:glycine oxidase ThiO [Planctomycetota bacterium]
MSRSPDVAVVGGGVVGTAIALRLAHDGRSVVLLERGDVGREASWAAGGILTPVHLAEYPKPLAGLCAASAALYPGLVDALRELSSVDVEFRRTGFLILVKDEATAHAARELEAFKRANGQPVETLTADEVAALQPGLGGALRGGLFLPDIAQVRNNRLALALAEAAQKRGVEIRRNTAVTGFLRIPGRVTGVKTSQGDLLAGTVVLAAGSWSGEILKPLGLTLPVKPVKGQILLTQAAPGLVRTIIEDGETYLVPRIDGRVLIGATMEDVGFDKTVTLDAVGGLASRAAAILPALAKLPLVTSWAGLRPSTPDRLPYIGPTSMEGLVAATGHFRNGILLAPITAELVADLLAGRPPSLDLAPFDPLRAVAPSEGPNPAAPLREG